MSQKLIFFYVVLVGSCFCQTGQWTTFGHDPQRSGWASDEAAFSPQNSSQMGLVWKTVVPNEPLSLNGLTAPLVIRSVATPRGNTSLVLVAGSSDHVYALNAETGALVWKADVTGEEKRPGPPSWLCPYALNATPVADAAHQRVFVIASDGRLHTLALADGHALKPPTRFVPPFSKMWSLNYVSGMLYTSLSQDCNNARSGIAAIEPDAPGRPVTTFYSTGACGKSFCGAGIWGRGGPAIDFDGFVYGATGDAGFDPAANMFGDTVLKLNPRLQLAGYFTPSIWEYLTRLDLDMGTCTPVVFRWRDRVLTAVGGKEGAIYVTDTASMSSNNHRTAAYMSPRYTNGEQTFEKNGIWGAMSTWKDANGDVWLYVPSWGQPTEAAKFPISNGTVKTGSVMAFQVTGDVGKPELRPAWISDEISVPEPVAIAGRVVFALGTGENTEQVRNGDISQILTERELRNTGHAILHALDASTGRELWSSRDTMTSWTHFSGLAIGDGKVFATTHDGAVYAFAVRAAGAPAPRVTVIPGHAPTPAASAPVVVPPAAVAAKPKCGEASAAFEKRCSLCHGENGKGLAGTHTPDFTDPAWQQSKTDPELAAAITNGKTGGMPAFGQHLSSEQIDTLVHCLIRGFAAQAQGR